MVLKVFCLSRALFELMSLSASIFAPLCFDLPFLLCPLESLSVSLSSLGVETGAIFVGTETTFWGDAVKMGGENPSGCYFSENVRKLKSVFGLRRRGRIAYEPIPKSVQSFPKVKINKDVFQVHTCLHQKHKTMWKNTSEMSQTRWVYIGGGAPWGTFGIPVSFLTRKVHPKCSKSDPKVTKLTPKVVPKWYKWFQNRQNLNLNDCLLKLQYSPADFSKCCNYVPCFFRPGGLWPK